MTALTATRLAAHCTQHKASFKEDLSVWPCIKPEVWVNGMLFCTQHTRHVLTYESKAQMGDQTSGHIHFPTFVESGTGQSRTLSQMLGIS